MKVAEKKVLNYFYENRKRYSIQLTPKVFDTLIAEFGIPKSELRTHIEKFEKEGLLDKVTDDLKTTPYLEYKINIHGIKFYEEFKNKPSVIKKVAKFLKERKKR